MSLSLAEEDIGRDVALPHPPRRRIAAALGLLAAGAVMLVSFAVLVAGTGEHDSTGSAIGRVAADFSLRDAQQQRVTLSQFRGRPVLLVMTAEPLGADLAQRLAALGPELAIVSVCRSEAPAQPQAAGIVNLSDSHGLLQSQYGLPALPAALLVSADGRILDSGLLGETLDRLSSSLRGGEPAPGAGH